MLSAGERVQDGALALRPPQINAAALATGVLLLAGGAAVLGLQSILQATLLVIGALLGLTLYQAAFGFTSAYRRLVLYRDVTGLRAQLLMLALATLLFAPVLAAGSAFGRGVVGAIAPAGWQVAIGAFMFGIGMQLGGGCGSGTLFGLGGGSLRLLCTLGAFIAGSFWASLHMGWWQELPSWPALALGDLVGWPAAVLAQFAFLAVLWFVAGRWGKTFAYEGPRNGATWYGWLQGPWPLVLGAVALAVLNFFTLITAGHPWSVTWAFTLWGAKIASALGWNPNSSAFWSGGFQQSALQASIFEDNVSLMDIGIMLGALCGAALAGRFVPQFNTPARSLIAAVVGGLMMGYGARIAFGCNIGAFFSGVASTSLHGWIWIATALPGNWIGVKLRPYFGLPN